MFTASSLPGSASPGTSGAVSTATFLGVPVWGWGAFMGLSCFPATHMGFLHGWCSHNRAAVLTEPSAAVPGLTARSNHRLCWLPVLALQRLVHTRAGFLHP